MIYFCRPQGTFVLSSGWAGIVCQSEVPPASTTTVFFPSVSLLLRHFLQNSTPPTRPTPHPRFSSKRNNTRNLPKDLKSFSFENHPRFYTFSKVPKRVLTNIWVFYLFHEDFKKNRNFFCSFFPQLSSCSITFIVLFLQSYHKPSNGKGVRVKTNYLGKM